MHSFPILFVKLVYSSRVQHTFFLNLSLHYTRYDICFDRTIVSIYAELINCCFSTSGNWHEYHPIQNFRLHKTLW